MKFNWGTGIAIVYAAFAIGMLTMVMISRKHDPGLVQKDYYNLDLNYQAHLNGKQNTAALSQKPAVRYDGVQKKVLVFLPEGMVASDGAVKLFRSSTIQDDQLVNLSGQNAIQIPADALAGGRWHVELNWTAGDKNYFFETAINI